MKKLIFGLVCILLPGLLMSQVLPIRPIGVNFPSRGRLTCTNGIVVYDFNNFLEVRDSTGSYSRLVRGIDLVSLRDSSLLYLQTDGTRPLTGDWNAGNYKILNTDTIQGQVVLAVGSMKTPTLQVTGLTATRVPYVSTGGLLTDNANFTYAASNGTLRNQYNSTLYTHIRANKSNVGIRAQFDANKYINLTSSVANTTIGAYWNDTDITSSIINQQLPTGTFTKLSRSDPNYWWEVHSGLTEGIVPYFKFYNADYEYSVPVAAMDLSEGNLLIGDHDGSTVGYNGNTDIFSTGIHGLRIKTDGNTEVIHHLFIDTISNGSTDVNKFLVSDNHEIKFRTDIQVKSDLGLVVGTNLLPTGTTGYTLYFNGTDWVANSNVLWNGAALVTTTAKYTVGATPGYFWSCTNADGSGEWVPFTGAVYKGQVDGDTGIPIDSVNALIDGTGVTGWWLVCVDAGTYDYGNPSGNVITLEIGDQLYYNGTKWIQIPGAGSYVLPTASPSVLGGIKVGNSLAMTSQVLNIKDGDKGDVDVSSTGTVFTIDTSAVTYNKIQNVSAQWKVLGRTSAGAGVIEEFSMSGTGNLLGSISPVVSDSLRVANVTYGTTWINSTGVPTKGSLVSVIEKINDSIANHSINYYTLRDTVQTSITDIVNLQDSITKHTDTLQLHATQIASKQPVGNYAIVNQTMYIGTTGVAINRGSGNLTLAGITLTSPTFTSPILGTPASGNLVNCTFPTLNQSTTGSAAKWTDDRRIYGHWVDGSINQDSVITVAYGGTGLATVTANSYLKGNGTGALVSRTYSEVRTDLGLGTMALETASRYRLQTQHDSLANQDDVTFTGITNGELIKWNGSKFINNTLDEAGIQGDVNLSTYNQNLIYNSSPYTTAETGIYAKNAAGSRGGFSTEFNVLYLSRTSSDTHVMSLDGSIVDIYTAQLKSTVSTGTKPFNIISTTLVDSLNAEFLDGHRASYFSTVTQLNSKLDTTKATYSNRYQWGLGYTDRMKWDGGSSGLVQATALTSLGLVVGTNLLPAGTTGQTLFYNGTAWVANSDLSWDNTNKSLIVGTTTSNVSLGFKAYKDYSGEFGIRIENPHIISSGGTKIELSRGAQYRPNHLMFQTGTTTEWWVGELYNAGSDNTGFSISTGANKSDSKFYVGSDGFTGVGYYINPASYLFAVNGTGYFNSTLKINSINNAGSNTNKILVSNAGVISFRTASEILSEIGAQAVITPANVTAGSNKITLGGTPTGAALQAFSIDVDQSKIDHNSLLNYKSAKHFYQAAIDSINPAYSTGILKVTTGTGKLSVATAGTDYVTTTQLGAKLDTIGGRISGNLGIGGDPYSWKLKVYGYISGEDYVSIHSTEVGKTTRQFILDNSDADNFRLYAYSQGESTYLPMRIGGTNDVNSGLKIDSTATSGELTPTGFNLPDTTNSYQLAGISIISDSINNGQIKRAPSQNIVFNEFLKFRKLTNHDSLSTLDEKSYNSLTDKPVLVLMKDSANAGFLKSDWLANDTTTVSAKAVATYINENEKVKHATVYLSSAQILAIHTTPVVIDVGCTTNQFVDIISCTLMAGYQTPGYDFSGGNLAIFTVSNVHYGSSQFHFMSGYWFNHKGIPTPLPAIPGASGCVENGAEITISTSTANPTGGAQTCTIYITYTLVDL